MSRIRNAIRVLMGQKTKKEEILLVRLDVAETLGRDAVKKMGIIENKANDVRNAHAMAILTHGRQSEELRNDLNDRRAKIKDLKRIIGTMKKEENKECLER